MRLPSVKMVSSVFAGDVRSKFPQLYFLTLMIVSIGCNHKDPNSQNSSDSGSKNKKLIDYFSNDTLIDTGLPDVKYFASKLSFSRNYLSDLLNKYAGKSTQEHIHLQLVDKAKTLLWGTEQSVSEIAFALGFEHPSHFTKIFKT
jgi:AraC-like DNA-binding protein